MTMKRQWMKVLILAAVLSVSINSLILSSLINRYFVDYTMSNYEKHYSQIVALSKKALTETNQTNQELTLQMETHLSDPITGIRLYDSTGRLLADVSSDSDGAGMMNGSGKWFPSETEKKGWMSGMMHSSWMNSRIKASAQEVDSVALSDAGVYLGKLEITRYNSFGNSLETNMFKVALIANSALSFGIVLLIMIIVGAVVSKRMSRELTDTASYATNMDLGDPIKYNMSKVKEIRVIQQSLLTLQTNLKLKQTSRKKLVDELVHQSRTPLTILKTHLEGFQDGILSMTPEEIKTCEDQINNLESIIANMSGMIDAGKEIDIVKAEEFELDQMLKQIVGGLKAQFDKKELDLSVLSHQRITLNTDKYKLSQCIYNILTNAYKYTMSGGKVSIAYESDEENNIIITIEDTGSGIGYEDKQHLFDAYFRGSSSNNIPGEGIGLYVAKENLLKINGTIDVVSEIGKGSRFIIKLPKKITQ